VGGTGRVLDSEGGFNRKWVFNEQNKSRWSVHHSMFVGLAQCTTTVVTAAELHFLSLIGFDTG